MASNCKRGQGSSWTVAPAEKIRRPDEDIRGRMHLLQPVLSIINLAFSWYTIFTEETLTP
jgi:hypothetical protein